MKRKVVLGLVLALIAISLPAPVAVGQGQEKVDVCHFVDEYWDFGAGLEEYGVIINIADPAIGAHIAHGDPEVWEDDYLPDGRAVCRTVDERIVFVSSKWYNGNLGGVAGADAKCQSLADAAQLPGDYKAWIADANTSPALRFTHNNGPYVLVDGVQVAPNWEGLVDGYLDNAINCTETGDAVGWHVWTGVATDGSYAGTDDCVGWTVDQWEEMGLGGHTSTQDDRWTSYIWFSCDLENRLYCFQQ